MVRIRTMTEEDVPGGLRLVEQAGWNQLPADWLRILRLTPGGRLKMRRRIGELERALGVEGTELARQEEAGTLPAERDRLELAMMVQAYDTERRLIQSQGAILGTPAVTLEEQGEEAGPDTTP